jgi:hypothetical protein
MLNTFVKRAYWYKGQDGYKSMKKVILSKTAKWPHRDIWDPLELTSFMTEEGFRTMCERVRQKPGFPASNRAVAFLAYNAGKLGLHDDALWDEIEFQMIRNMHDLNNRLLFGL